MINIEFIELITETITKAEEDERLEDERKREKEERESEEALDRYCAKLIPQTVRAYGLNQVYTSRVWVEDIKYGLEHGLLTHEMLRQAQKQHNSENREN